MKIKLEDLENMPDGELTVQFDEIIEELENDKPVKGELKLSLSEYAIKIQGEVETELMLECDRCLSIFPHKVNVTLDEMLARKDGDYEYKHEIELKKDDFIIELDNKNEIDVTDIIYQSIIIEVPFKKLCNEDCAGTEEYQKLLAEETEDPRLKVFKDLTDKMK